MRYDLPNQFSIPEFEAHISVEAVVKYYPDHMKVYVPNSPYQKLLPDLELVRKIFQPKPKANQSGESNLERSLRRTVGAIQDYVYCNNFSIFATFTFADHRQNVEKCKRRLNDWIKNQQRRYGKFDYIIVPEFHKDGKSLHFHALFKDFNGKLAPAFNGGKRVRINSRPAFNFKSYTLGFNSAVEIDQSPESRAAIARYLKKYLTKDMPTFKNKQRYWVSNGLDKPEIEINPEKWYLIRKPKWSIILPNGTVMVFDYPKLEGDGQ